MAIPSPTFIFGVVVVLYLSSFVLFAILRTLTGISIQRIGYFSLRRLSFTPKDGIKVELRGLGVNLHRPTFSQPTWISVVLTDLAVTVDLKALDGENGHTAVDGCVGSYNHRPPSRSRSQCRSPEAGHSNSPSRVVDGQSKSWDRLTRLKNRIKRLHRSINWIRLVDMVATNSSVSVLNVGKVEIGAFTMAVDTRRKMVTRGQMFAHWKKDMSGQKPAEWIFTMRTVLFTCEGQEAVEVLDHAALNIHGLLCKELDGLRDASIALKLGRVHLPTDDIQTCVSQYELCSKSSLPSTTGLSSSDASITDIALNFGRPEDQEQHLDRDISESRDFVSSILRGIKEIQFAVSYVGVTHKIQSIQPAGPPIYLNASMKEVGFELHRLDPRSPAHRMYFSSKDIAHQALFAALSIAFGVDEGHGNPDRLLYIPMATTTVMTTLPSKIVEFSDHRSADARNANMLFANVVVTSPSVDLDPKHLPLVLALMQPKLKTESHSLHSKQVLISRLLPKSNIKISVHEPVIRIALPPVEATADADDFDLIISSISSVSLVLESSHSEGPELHYTLASSFRVQSHDLYYQTTSATRYNLLQTETLELRAQINASPEVQVVASGTLQTFSVQMIRPEISDGVRQIVGQLRTDVESDKKACQHTSKNPNILRAIPPWLLHFQFQALDFNAEVAGVDVDISDDTRGVAVQLESWTAEYCARKLDAPERRPSRRRTGSKALLPDSDLLKAMPQLPQKSQQHAGDGRRLAVHVRGLEAFIIEAAEKLEMDPFLSIPRFEVAFSTSSDRQGPVIHVNSHVRSLLVQYSLYRHYAIGIATTVVRKALVRTTEDLKLAAEARAAANKLTMSTHLSPIQASQNPSPSDSDKAADNPRELVTVHLKASLIQFKAHLPSDPPLMLQIYGMEVGRHRWSQPFFQAKLVRLYAEAPKMRRVWTRIASVKTARIDLRESRRKTAVGNYENEKLIDVNAEAIRLAVPHQLVLHEVFDNIVNTMKATEQLHHRFKTGTNDYILEKSPEGPRHVPKISIRSRALLFELEDGAFEWKLGTIYRAGLLEQQQRLAREQAFSQKAKRIAEEEQQQQRRESSRFRTRSTHNQDRNHAAESRQESKSDDEHSGRRGRSHSNNRHRRMRYDPDGICGMSATAKISIQEARAKMLLYNAQSWKKRIDHSYCVQNSGMKDLRGVFWGPDELPDDLEDTEDILEVPQRPALMGTLISDLHITIDKPSFPLSELPEFLHRIGKGMPYDMKYSLLIPLHVQIDMGETRMTLRDYPLPLLHVPATKAGQSSRLPSWSLTTDFVIAEEFRGPQSVRHVKVAIIPSKDSASEASNGSFAIDVRRTISPVKSYSDLNIDINTSLPTRITWGASYQPAIQDMMMVFEGFTKPQIDPSDRTGFWDKIRLSFHSRVLVSWKRDGDVHLMLKGTRDPYAVTGNGAGFLMCWRNDVRWSIWRENDHRKFMTVDSGDYILAIPDFSHQARDNDISGHDEESVSSSSRYKQSAVFKKVIMKLSGKVQWLAGLVFERNLGDGTRSFDFEPHYNVVLKEPSFAKGAPGRQYDAFDGFRSHHIHLSIAVKAPSDRDWALENTQPSRSYNTVHLTPRFFTHFFAWWSMFGGTMSLPIRQGRLWPGIEKSSKKFGRHLATIKYNLLFAPLFLSHIYKHKEAEDYSSDVVTATGLKIRLDSFTLDMHQRREEFNTQGKGRKLQTKTTGMKIHKAQLDLLSADVRAVSASIAGTTTEDHRKASASSLVSQQDPGVIDLSRFVIPDNDFSWIDMDDFVELDWILPFEANPETKIMPLAFAPRLTYFRQTDHGDTIAGDPDRKSPFGHEPTHYCIMSHDDDPRRVQCELIKARLEQLKNQRIQHEHKLGEAELNLVRDDGRDSTLKMEVEELKKHEARLQDKYMFLESMLHRMSMRFDTNNRPAVPDDDADRDSDDETPVPKLNETDARGMDSTTAADFVSEFNNRFVIHNMQLKWNDSLRNIIVRYIHQVSQRRGFVYYLSRPAVKFILDIVEEQSKAKAPKANPPTQPDSPADSSSSRDAAPAADSGVNDVEERIKELLADANKFVDADHLQNQEPSARFSTDHLASNLGKDFTSQDSYHLRLIAPQIQLQSEKNPSSVVVVTAKGMELKVVEVKDKERIFDDVSGLVQRRFSLTMDSTQFFVAHKKAFSTRLLSMYSGSHYGTPAGSVWPPWVPMEVMFDFEVDPFGFKRVVQKTSASLRYDKYNTLRLKYNDEIGSDEKHGASPDNLESRMDHLWVEFPKIRAICDSAQYYAMYVIVLDLLLYNEPLEKTRTERLEKIMLASDFSDLRGAPEMVVRLQERIRQLEEIKTQFQIHAKVLDKKGWEDRILLEQDLASCEDELFFMMKAITTSQRKYDGSQSNGLLRWNISSEQIVWHLMREKDQPLMEFQLRNAEYDRTDNSDGSHINLMQIGKITGLNLLPDAIYPEMIAPYFDADRSTINEGGQEQMVRVYWYMLEAIAGIPVMDHFEINLFPMKIQLEREVGKKLFEYIFPSSRDKEKSPENGKSYTGFLSRPVQLIQDEDDDDDDNSATTSTSRNPSVIDAAKQDSDPSLGADSLELRLKPTLNSDAQTRSSRFRTVNAQTPQNGEGSHFRLFHQNSSRPQSIRTLGKTHSMESLGSMNAARPSLGRSFTNSSNMDASSTNSEGKSKRFALHRNGKQVQEKEKRSDDLTKMMSRASNYTTVAYIKIPSVVLCLSYKGKGERNIGDVHDFVFRLPELEYRNKTWSNLDLALALKRDVIKALISHTGAIIGNKFSKHRPSAVQQSRLRELASSSTLLAPSRQDPAYESSDRGSNFGTSPSDTRGSEHSKSPPRSIQSNSDSLARIPSDTSSLYSFHDSARGSIPAVTSMTSTRPTSRNASVAESHRTSSNAPPSTYRSTSFSYTEREGHNGNFMTDTKLGRRLNALGDKIRDRSEGSSHTSGAVGDDGEDTGRKKSKLLLGKKILGGLGDR
ncbi:MAG: hypothetical protein M1818_006871 [Claussenomyces sp. TS43310]|nr:MAG: hypothetical protein M1818_006871 [Claussenomyces sp. TS43310]